jgi:hypothetical protein
MLGLLLLLLLCMAVHSQDHVLDAGGGVVVHVCAGPSCVAPYAVLVHGRAWLVAPPTAGASFLGEPLTLASVRQQAISATDKTLHPPLKPGTTAPSSSTALTMGWVDSQHRPVPFETSMVLNADMPGAVVFRQRFIDAVSNSSIEWRGAKGGGCDEVEQGWDQVGGRLLANLINQTAIQCCDACGRAAACDTWVMVSPDARHYYNLDCRLYTGSTGRVRSGTKALGGRPGRRLPAAADPNSALAAFPVFVNGKAEAALNVISWGSCQLAGTSVGRWTNSTTEFSASSGIPVVLFDKTGGSAALSPAEHYLVAVHSTRRSGVVEMGIKASVGQIPAGFTHDTLLYASSTAGVDATLVGWGDVLLRKAGKGRVDPYQRGDFALSHLGHWNDAVRKTTRLSHFHTKAYHFTKTGSGNT